MNQITKIVQQIGNGGHIYLPREIVGQKVVISLVEKSIGDIEEEILTLLKPYLKQVEGIYLYGSYSRNEQTTESDIDVLVITDGKIEIKKKVNEYEITCATIEQIENTLKNNAVLILPILRESRAILNGGLIKKYTTMKLNKKNTSWYIETTESALKLAKYAVEEDKITDMPGIVYSLILRLRGLLLIKLLIDEENYSNKKAIDYLIKDKIQREKAEQEYRMYREHRDDKSISKNSLNAKDMGSLYKSVYNLYFEVKSIWEKLK
ncbi:MAG: DUF2080 family transposase-associated protein [Nanoarchaeota archaeon]|nr:DUF2080 family transposase-associated protein [Nanoarchaeota archaeon]MBU1004458.1 DUF2080 family transposase-associated protein [Nanoarchaeota archaeon]MBU1946792.1 DUF2080 family transposase-associated protein [Nanoarchaeota archaeon]